MIYVAYEDMDTLKARVLNSRFCAEQGGKLT